MKEGVATLQWQAKETNKKMQNVEIKFAARHWQSSIILTTT